MEQVAAIDGIFHYTGGIMKRRNMAGFTNPVLSKEVEGWGSSYITERSLHLFA